MSHFFNIFPNPGINNYSLDSVYVKRVIRFSKVTSDFIEGFFYGTNEIHI